MDTSQNLQKWHNIAIFWRPEPQILQILLFENKTEFTEFSTFFQYFVKMSRNLQNSLEIWGNKTEYCRKSVFCRKCQKIKQNYWFYKTDFSKACFSQLIDHYHHHKSESGISGYGTVKYWSYPLVTRSCYIWNVNFFSNKFCWFFASCWGFQLFLFLMSLELVEFGNSGNFDFFRKKLF